MFELGGPALLGGDVARREMAPGRFGDHAGEINRARLTILMTGTYKRIVTAFLFEARCVGSWRGRVRRVHRVRVMNRGLFGVLRPAYGLAPPGVGSFVFGAPLRGTVTWSIECGSSGLGPMTLR